MCASEESKCASVRISPCALCLLHSEAVVLLAFQVQGRWGHGGQTYWNRRANLIIFNKKEALLLSALESPPSDAPDLLSLRRTAVLNTVVPPPPHARQVPRPQCSALCEILKLCGQIGSPPPPGSHRPATWRLSLSPWAVVKRQWDGSPAKTLKTRSHRSPCF